MPFAVGGGIRTLKDIQEIISRDFKRIREISRDFKSFQGNSREFKKFQENSCYSFFLFSQKNNQNKKVYGVFVALDILLNVIDYFLIHHAFHKHPTSNKNILIVPMPLNVFNILYKNMVKSKKSESELKKFFEDIEQTTNSKKCSKCNMPDLTMQDFQKNYEENFDKLLKRL